MMEHIIKSLATKDTATVILVLGLTREARLWHKQIIAEVTLDDVTPAAGYTVRLRPNYD